MSRFGRSEPFADRREAGQRLGAVLAGTVAADGSAFPSGPDVLVLGLARGGVPVAREVADTLDADLDVLVVRKIGAPGQPEFAMGAIATGGHVVVNDDVPRRLGVSAAQFDAALARERRILADREHRYRAGRGPLQIAGRTVVLVDDGLATGASMSVALVAMRSAGAGTLVVAVPTAPADVFDRLRVAGADMIVAVTTPDPFHAVGQSYRDFSQVGDDAVLAALTRGRS
ncbi:phosphoribosyltransferase family protein [Gordonia sp. ABSL1-1]|uniref:phosphoribosyltransferase n=1 Tax=Gordonia sp. ABSL1-1 TaxID=3053923 RepID=UPI0025739EFE|nr:phosphoribosyltransferase family protein [Gordonia sp. ABSL1-1]MDL9938384.1 phosphoribosyltransferase family protein [Gordonia sp. ABSL1-1]